MNARHQAPEDLNILPRHLFGAFAAHTIGAAVRLGVVEAIGDRQRTAAEVAAGCESDPGSTLRLLRAMTAMKLLAESEPGVYRVTPAGRLLDAGQPGSLASLARVFTEPWMVRAWEDLTGSVRTGRPAFPAFFGQSFFDYLQDRPEASAEFNAFMGEATRASAHLLPDHVDFGRFGTVVDVGGGDGTLLATVLRRYPGVRGVIYDTPSGLAQAADVMRRAGVEDRFTAEQDDFFVSVPGGGDLYLLKAVLHDWNDERCLTILRNVRQAMPDDGRLLIVEAVLPDRVDPKLIGGYLGDLNMLVNLGGRERTADDFRALCEKAGFVAPAFERLPIPGDVSLIQATPARS
jgi:hypothetical protein